MGCTSSSENDRGAVGGASYVRDEAETAAALIVAGGQKLFSDLQLSISLKKLRNKDKASLSDPFVVVYISTMDQPEWREVGRTEIQANSLDPKFVKFIHVTYQFEIVQNIRFDVFDADSKFSSPEASKNLVLSKQDYQGSAEVALARIVGSRAQTWTQELLKGTPPTAGRGSITVRAEEMANMNALVQIDMHAIGLANMDRLSRSDPFLVFSRLNEDGSTSRCYKTEVIQNNLSPTWARITAPMATLCNGDVYRPMLVECFDYEGSGRHKPIGSCKLSINDMVQAATGRTGTPLQSPEAAAAASKASSSSASKRGMLFVDSCVVIPRPSFFDFISAGTEINFVVAVDFTASNGHPSQIDSLHYAGPNAVDNQYASAIKSIGSILEFYSTTQTYAAYGFGGVPPGQSVSSHCFPLNGNEEAPEVAGVDGILQAYRSALHSVRLSGPTLFSPVISQTAALAASTVTRNPNEQRYWVLLLMTDGLLGDMDNTVEAIVSAASLPLSIIMVGVGKEDFTAMRVLDGDEQRLRSARGNVAERDIVQFVAMRDVAGRGPHVLAKEVLAELPGQLLSYMQGKGILPPAKPAATPLSPRTQQARRNSAAKASAIAPVEDVPPPPYQA